MYIDNAELVLKEIITLCQSIVNLENKLNSDDHIELAEKVLGIFKNQK